MAFVKRFCVLSRYLNPVVGIMIIDRIIMISTDLYYWAEITELSWHKS